MTMNPSSIISRDTGPETPELTQQELLRTMVEGIKTGVVICSDVAVIYANPEFGRLLGYAEDESLEGMSVVELVADSDQRLAAQRRKAVAAGRQVPTGWIKFRGKGGVLVQMMPNLSRVFWNGQPHFITAANRASDQDLLDIQVRKTRARYERLLVAELEKRQADMARELHDSLGSELAGMSLMLGGLKSIRPGDADLRERIDKVLGQLEKAVDITRGMARGLMPVDPHAGGFWRAMERLASDWTLLRGVPCDFTLQGNFDSVPADTGTHLYRIAQEAIANALRHGHADRLHILLSEREGEMVMEVEDNGCGFDPVIVNAIGHQGLGIRSMMARARTVGGRIEFPPGADGGSCIRVIWPGRGASFPPRY
jgi:PAS domain S-box-containing protein